MTAPIDRSNVCDSLSPIPLRCVTPMCMAITNLVARCDAFVVVQATTNAVRFKRQYEMFDPRVSMRLRRLCR